MQTNVFEPMVPVARLGVLPFLKGRIFLFLAASAVAVLLLSAVPALTADTTSGTASVHGLILDSEMGAVLEADNGDMYFLEGPDMTPYVDVPATVTGTLTRDEGGNMYIDVTAVLPDLDTPAGRNDPLDINDETGMS